MSDPLISEALQAASHSEQPPATDDKLERAYAAILSCQSTFLILKDLKLEPTAHELICRELDELQRGTSGSYLIKQLRELREKVAQYEKQIS